MMMKVIIIEACTEMVLKFGGSAITMKSGEIVIKSAKIKLDGKITGTKDADFKKKLKNPSLEAK